MDTERRSELYFERQIEPLSSRHFRVIAGNKDMIRKSHTRLIAVHIPGSELVIIPGNHFYFTFRCRK